MPVLCHEKRGRCLDVAFANNVSLAKLQRNIYGCSQRQLWAGRSSCYICSCQWVGLEEGNQNNNLSGFLNEFSSREGLVLFSWAHAAAA